MNRLTDSELIDELKKRFEENEKVLDSLKVVNAKLVDVNRKLQESETLKSNFLSNIRNEINNPLTSILFIAKELSSPENFNKETVPSMASTIYDEVFNLDSQLRNIFATAEYEAGESSPSISRADIDSLIDHAIESFTHKADDKQVSITFGPLSESGEDTCFNTDPEKLHLIITNLLNNAIEFSHNGGLVEIEACKKEGNLTLSVKDHGIGIEPSEHAAVFDRFKQLDSGVSKSHLGHGLGASITKSMVEALNGTISLSSASGQGSTFTVSIPEAENAAESEVLSGDSNEFFFEVEEEQEF
jgi:signal transduction histidine kinase